MEFEIGIGKPAPLGAIINDEIANFAVHSENAEKIELCLFSQNGEKEIARFEMANKSGNVFHCSVKGVRDFSYGFRAFGPHSPNEGQRFNSNKLLLDPYSKKITEPFALHKSMFDNDIDSADYMPKAIIVEKPDFEPRASFIPLDQSVIYELHLKGFSEKFPNLEENERGRWAALRNPRVVTYFKELGVNCLEIMPCAAWIDERHLRDLGLKNYWGYNPIAFMAPDPRYAPNGFEDVFKTVKTLESHGIETIIDIVFNHSGESDEFGPIVSMRGLDNLVWYSLQNDKSKYQNPAGTGNILNSQNSNVLEFMLETMRVWHLWGGVHGFRFDLATVMARVETGFEEKSAFFNAINNDAILSKLKMIAEPWDCETYQLGQFPNNFGEWNDRFRDDMRKFWLKDSVSIGAFAHAFCGSQSIFGETSPAKSINYIVAHDGFTLHDLVSYNQKNNNANGENNRDGSSENHSYNHGIEGETFDGDIIAARKKAQKNLLASLILSRGVPMLSMGCELGHTQYGNNNSYCQDNELNYLNWEKADSEIFEFTKLLFNTRTKFSTFRKNSFYTGQESKLDRNKDIAWFNLWGQSPNDNEWHETQNGFLGAAISDPIGQLVLIINRTNDLIEFCLPQPLNFENAQLVFDTSGLQIDINKIEAKSIKLLHLSGQIDEDFEIDHVAKTYGIDIDWWDVDGNCHKVPNKTKFAIMREFGFDIETKEGRENALSSYSRDFETRCLPHVLTFDLGEEIKVPISFPINSATKNGMLVIRQNGEEIIEIKTHLENPVRKTDCLGNYFLQFDVPVKPLPIGRYEIEIDDYQCALLVAPKQAFMPPSLEENCFGLSAQSYAFVGEYSKDFGDFSVLNELLETAQNWGAKLLAVNPFHALFETDRAFKSPYYPSHRAFIDPLYFPISGQKSKGALIDYVGASSGRIKALEIEYNNSKNQKGFKEFCSRKGQSLENFALFSLLCRKFGSTDTRKWPPGFQNPQSPKCLEFTNNDSSGIELFKYMQFRLFQELENAIKGKTCLLCRDLAIGSAPNGAEIWSNPEYFAKNISIGAPPDPLGPLGQVWGLPPPLPMEILKNHLKDFRDLLHANMEFAGALRIDHAMGIMRQFWIPNSMSGKDGAYVRMPFKELWAQIRISSHENQCIIIAEDLGTVPTGFSETMNNANALSYKILLFEKNDEGFYPIQRLKEMAFACASTHDLPPLAAWWHGFDLDEKLNLCLSDLSEFESAKKIREEEKRQLLELIKSEKGIKLIDFDAQLVAAIHTLIAKSPAKLAIIQFEDLAQTEGIINLPGTNLERPNWQLRIEKSVKQIAKSKFALEIINEVSKLRH